MGFAVLRYGQFVSRYFGNSILKMRYCTTCGMRFFSILDGIKNYPPSPPTFSEPFPVSDFFFFFCFAGLQYLPNFFVVLRCSETPNAPLLQRSSATEAVK